MASKRLCKTCKSGIHNRPSARIVEIGFTSLAIIFLPCNAASITVVPLPLKWVVNYIAGIGITGNKILWQGRLKAGTIGYLMEVMSLPLFRSPELTCEHRNLRFVKSKDCFFQLFLHKLAACQLIASQKW
jgi:hypothetical protein